MTDTTTQTTSVTYEPVAVLATANRALIAAVTAMDPRVEIVDLRDTDPAEGDLDLAPRSGVLLLVPALGDVLRAVGGAHSLLLTDDLDDATVWAQAVNWHSSHVVVLPDGRTWLTDTIREHFSV